MAVSFKPIDLLDLTMKLHLFIIITICAMAKIKKESPLDFLGGIDLE
jgi:hypothetical protein